MDRRMKSLPRPTTETFHPNYERSVEGSNYLLRVDLPGFSVKDFSVGVDHTGKLTIKGRKQTDKNTYVLLDETYNIPQDSDYKKVTGKFDDGCLVLTMPKTIKPTTLEEKKPSHIINEGAAKEIKQEPQKALPSVHDNKKIADREKTQDAPAQVEKMKKSDDQGREKGEISQTKSITSPPDEKKIEDREKVAAEILSKPKSTASPPDEKKIEDREKVAADQIPLTKSTSPPNEKKNIEERAEISQTKVSVPKENKKSDQEADHQDDEGSKKKKITHDEKKDQEFVMGHERKNEVLCKRKFREEGLLDHGVVLLDSLIERINNNKKVILVAVVAISVGFYVSHKLRSSGK